MEKINAPLWYLLLQISYNRKLNGTGKRKSEKYSTKEIWGGKSYKVHSPLLNRIVFPEYIVKFAYFSSSSSLSAISLYNRNMELISSVSSTGGALARGLAFCDKNGKKTSGIEFNYYEKSDFPVWKETGVDLWGYPYAEDEDEECTDYEI